MNRHLLAASMLIALPLAVLPAASAQSLDDLNLQLHGYATQGFIYSNQNSWNTTDSSSGSASWTEAVLNISAQPDPRLRISMQARFSSLGDFGQNVTLDYAQGDYKVNDRIGFRAGKVKTPMALWNETQDVDPVHLWVLLPQSIYPITSRDSQLAHYGGVVYGSMPLGESLGKVEYRAFAGQRVLSAEDGYFQLLRDEGIDVPNGTTGHTGGGTLRWLPPVRGLVAGLSEVSGSFSGEIAQSEATGNVSVNQFRQTFGFLSYERNRLMLAAEYSRSLAAVALQFQGYPDYDIRSDRRPWYIMGTWKLSSKLSTGLYYSYTLDHQAALSSARFQKDWALAARFDPNAFLYLKFEQHFLDGTAIGFSTADNPNLNPSTRLSLLKLGVSF